MFVKKHSATITDSSITLVADNTLRSLNSQHQAIAAQHHQIFSRLQTLEAGNPSLKLEAPPSPQVRFQPERLKIVLYLMLTLLLDVTAGS